MTTPLAHAVLLAHATDLTRPPGFEVIATAMHHVLLAAVVLGLLLTVVRFLTAHTPQARRAACATGASVLVMFTLASAVLPVLMDGGSRTSPAAGPSASAAPTPAAPSPAASRPPSHVRVPWETVALIVVGLLAVAAVLVLALVAVRALARRRRAAAARAHQLALLQGRHDCVLQAWGAVETNLLEVFAAPLITDVSVPQTAAFTRSYGEAAFARDLVGDRPVGPGGEDPALERYAAAVREFEHTWAVAIAHARRVGHAFLPPVERRRLARAVALLHTALDDGAAEAERQACYVQAMRLVADLVTLPRTARAGGRADPPLGFDHQPAVRAGPRRRRRFCRRALTCSPPCRRPCRQVPKRWRRRPGSTGDGRSY